MLMSASALLVVTSVLIIISTMKSKPGINWWIAGAILQSATYIITYSFLYRGQNDLGIMTFFVLFMGVNQAVCLGILRFIDVDFNPYKRLLLLLFAIAMIAISKISGFSFTAELIFVFYSAIVVFQAASHIWRYEHADIYLKIVGYILVVIGIHWLNYLIIGKIEWVIPVGFMFVTVLSLSLFFTLAIIAMLQFKKMTKDSEDKAIRAAIHDPLTDLYNRSHLSSLFDKYQAASLESQSTFVMLYIDLDGFKTVNDTYGHKAGDVILKVVAKRFKRWLGNKGDALRIGGDELVILNMLRSDKMSDNDIIYGTSAAESILKLIEKPIVHGANSYSISASIGGCYYGAELNDLEAMLSQADQLMYSVKKAGGRKVSFGDAPRQLTSEVSGLLESATVMNRELETPLIS